MFRSEANQHLATKVAPKPSGTRTAEFESKLGDRIRLFFWTHDHQPPFTLSAGSVEKVHLYSADECCDKPIRGRIADLAVACRLVGCRRFASRSRSSPVAKLLPDRLWQRKSSRQIARGSSVVRSRFKKGSSRRSFFAFRTRAQARATRCRLPPESLPGLRSRQWLSLNIAAASQARVLISPRATPRGFNPNAIFSWPLGPGTMRGIGTPPLRPVHSAYGGARFVR